VTIGPFDSEIPGLEYQPLKINEKIKKKHQQDIYRSPFGKCAKRGKKFKALQATMQAFRAVFTYRM